MINLLDPLDHDSHITEVHDIIAILTQDQKTCILQLSSEWKDRGYNKVFADIIYCSDSFLFPGRFAPLVEVEYYQPEGQYSRYRHRLTELGCRVKHQVEKDRGEQVT